MTENRYKTKRNTIAEINYSYNFIILKIIVVESWYFESGTKFQQSKLRHVEKLILTVGILNASQDFTKHVNYNIILTLYWVFYSKTMYINT